MDNIYYPLNNTVIRSWYTDIRDKGEGKVGL